MKKQIQKNWNRGFTLTEALVVTAVVIILLCISAAAVVHYRDGLKITRLDNAAREIYLAAENRAVLLSGGRRLGMLVGQGGNTVTLLSSDGAGGEQSTTAYYIDQKNPMLEKLLPAGSIDPSLREGWFYIVYEPVSGCVTDVFYAEREIGTLGEPDFQHFYDRWISEDKSIRKSASPMLGYYGGGMAEGAEIGALSTPTVTVMIQNGERLTATVSYWLPDSIASESAELGVELEYGGTKISLTDSRYANRRTETSPESDSGGVTYTSVWVLDALEDSRQFAGLFSGQTECGGDFTVRASVSSLSGTFKTVTDEDQNNSLFAEESGGTSTAYIKNLRHLQNLDAAFSGAAGKTAAVQTADIRCSGNETYPGYEFVPIENAQLGSYHGQTFEIYGLRVTEASAAGKTAAGLFASAKNGMQFTGVRLVNAAVSAGDTGFPAGALAGVAENAKLDGCWVYWEPEDGGSNLRSLLGSDSEGDHYRYQIVGSSAGGLVGVLSDGTIANCLSATMVKGNTAAGGLVGSLNVGTLGMTMISNSYADCYLTGDNAAGLIGNLNGKVNLTNCYTAGFIDAGSKAAGLCLGGGETATEQVYSVVRYVQRGGSVYALTEQQDIIGDGFIETFYLGTGTVGTALGQQGLGRSYAEMTARTFSGTMGNAFGWKTARDSRPYNLREHLNLVSYSFPGLASLPHYGDWGAEFKEPSLVYYEQYGDETYGFSGGNARYLIGELSDDKTIVSDGYAVAFLKQDLGAEKNVRIIYTYFDAGGKTKEEAHAYFVSETGTGAGRLIETTWKNDEGNEAEYYLALLPEEMVDNPEAREDFFQYLKFVLEIGGETPSGEYFYNPHFAETVVPYVLEEDAPAGWTAESANLYARELVEQRNAVSIRTPRHLYDLSRFQAYYSNERHRFAFRQGLDLDYAGYTGYHLFQETPFRQAPIGSWNAPFHGVYDGGCHTIEGVTFYVPTNSGRFYAGLFGFSDGVLRNIVYQMDAEKETAVAMGNGSQNLYVGALIGGNAGTIQNCAVAEVRLTGYAFGATIYVGGLAGQNNGIIRSCAAELASLSADGSNYAHAYVGGLVGENALSRSVSTSYAVGRITASADSTSDARICGFVGYNSGHISHCYTAADLQTSGLNIEAFGFCGVRSGSQEDTWYLNEGNFTYRGVSYTADHSPVKAQSAKYELLAGTPSCVDGMQMNARASEGGVYPYPAAVTDAAGKPVHYGRWPVQMELGEMGIYYWEKLEIGDAASYHVSLLAVDPNARTIDKQSTLSTAHDDGGIVTEYGYGYYEKNRAGGSTVSFTANNLLYSAGGGAGGTFIPSVPSDKTVDAALEALMGDFTFHSYHSFGPGGGLYPDGSPNGTLTLVQGPVAVTFAVNPHFADAFSAVVPAGWKAEGAALPTSEPGSEENPYGVRSVAQLEFINWNKVNRDTRTVLTWWTEQQTSGPWWNPTVTTVSKTNCDEFPYLSSSNTTGKYFWVQSHDLNGNGETYTPIAEYYDTTNTAVNLGYLYGWFGGSYDGADYVIENVNIQGQTASCAGLFGVVYNGTLKNIILYSSDGKGVVASGHDEQSDSRWYAIGALAGVAASHTEGSAVQNCAVAGYTIQANTFTSKGGWGGSGIGGLLGISNMALTDCAAVTDIQIPATAQDNDNMRVGGLVGTCQQSITNCYAGGSIQIDQTKDGVKGVYIGGLVGGSYMKPLRVEGGVDKTIGYTADTDGLTSNALINCYGYVVLPAKTDHNKIKALYALGGTGEINPPGEDPPGQSAANHGVCQIENCFYLTSALDKNGGQISAENGFKTDVNGTAGVTGLTHKQLANQAAIRDGRTIYSFLSAFHPVTSEIDGFSVAGKYSYPPSSRGDLQGMNYPFPTILTRGGAGYHVHYGEWPADGIKRTDGGAPIALDLFTQTTHEELLELTPGVPQGGVWEVESTDETVAASTVTAAGGGVRLAVRAVGEGTARLTVRYARPDGTNDQLTLTVNVTARLELRPSAAALFPNDSVTISLLPYGRVPDSGEVRALPLEGLNISSISCDSLSIRAFRTDRETEGPGILLTSGTETDTAMVSVGYVYTHAGIPHTGIGTVSVTMLEPPKAVWSGGACVLDFGGYPVTELTAEVSGGQGRPPAATAEVKDTAVILTNVREGAAEILLDITLTMDGQKHVIAMTVPVTPAQP